MATKKKASGKVKEKMTLGTKDGGRTYTRNTILTTKQKQAKVKKLEKDVKNKTFVYGEYSAKTEGKKRADLMHARVAAAKAKKRGLQSKLHASKKKKKKATKKKKK